MINLFKKKDKNLQYQCLLDFDKDNELYKEIINVQNNISVFHSTKVLGISSFNNSFLSSAFAKAFANVYALNDESVLIIDADLYEGQLREILNISSIEEVVKINDKIDCLCCKKEAYPSDVYKTGFILDVLKKHVDNYDHIILVAPQLKDHTDILLFANSMDCLLIPVRKNETEKKSIFNEIHFFESNDMSTPEFVILK